MSGGRADRLARLEKLSPAKQALLARALRERAARQQGGAIPRRPGSERGGRGGSSPAPLSFGQQRLWLERQMSPDSPVYNLPVAVRIEGRLDARALAAALSEVVRRHEVLRSGIERRGEELVQVVAPAAAVPLALADLSGLPASGRQAEVARLGADHARRLFDLSRPPLVRAALLALGGDEHRLLLALHHIAADGWSSAILVRELGELYAARAAGRPSPLGELPIQYADWAAWQRGRLAGELLAAELDYWRERLAGLPPLELPADRPRPPAASFRGRRRERLLAPRLHGALADLSRRQGATMFMTLAAGFAALLGRWTGQDDLAVGTPVAGRTRLETEGLIGFFVNILVLRADLAGSPSFTQLLSRLRATVAAAHAHQELPFERLVEELAPARDPGGHPLVQAILALHNAAREQLALPGLALTLLETDTGTAKLDLALEIVEQPEGGLAAGLEVASDLFDATTAARLLGHFEALLAGAAAAPAMPLRDLPLLGAAEIHQLVREHNDTRSAYPRDSAVAELFAEWARAAPQAPAVLAEGREPWSYGRLAAESHRLAWHLRSLGVERESRVGVSMERSPELIAALLAILQAGGAYVPLDPGYPDSRLRFMLQDTGTRLLLVHEPTRQRLAALEWPDGAPPVRLLCVDAEREVIAGRGSAPPPRSPVSAGAEGLAYVLYTSGSTGQPKGVAVPHRAIARLVRGTNYVRLGPADRVAHLSNISFDAATFEIWGALANGGATVVIEREAVLSPARLAARLREAAVTAMFLTAALFDQVVGEQPAAFSALRHLLVGGDALDPQSVARALAAGPPERLLNGYGPTESTTFAVWHEVRHVPPGSLSVPIGRPLANTTAHVVDRRGELASTGQVGELWLGGDGLARGYLGRPDLTAERFVPDRWSREPGGRLYRTGDLARRRWDGVIDCLGRIDQQVKIRGFRVEPGEIEAVLAACPGVRDCAVVARLQVSSPAHPITSPAPPIRSPALVAYVVAAPAAGLREALVWEHLRRSLPGYMLPVACRFVESLPLTPNAKLDRAALAALDPLDLLEITAGPPAQDYAAPRDPIEELLAGIWEKVLGIDRIGVRDDFFVLGGHSLLAARLAARVHQVFGIDLPLRTLFETPTVAGVAAAIRATLATRSPRSDTVSGVQPPAPIPRAGRGEGGPRPLSFGQQRLWFIYQMNPRSAAYNLLVALLLAGALDRRALAAALAEVVRRHEVLRTAIVAEGGPAGAAQRLTPPPAPRLPVVDLSGLAEPVAGAESLRLAAAEALQPFDLGRPPLLRAALLALAAPADGPAGGSAGGGPPRHLLVLTLHHIAADGWSSAILVRETAALYAAFAAGRQSPLPEPPLQYADWAAWQRGRLSGELLASQLAWWRQRLAGLPDLRLPADRPRPAVESFRGLRRSRLLPAGASARLDELSRRQGATLFMTLAAAFAAVLRRLGGEEDFGLGTPIAGRTRMETEGLIGFFVNTLVLRFDVPGDPAFSRLLAHAREALLEGYSHQDLPFERLVEELAPRRDLSRQPLVQAFVVLQNTPREPLALPGLTATELAVDNRTAKTDLTLDVARAGGGLRAELEANHDLFDAATAARMLSHLETLLAAAAADPEQPLSRLPLLSAAERHQMIVEWGGLAEARAPAGWTLHNAFESRARLSPAALALSCAGEQVSYGELDARANRLARHLRSLGAGPEVRVGLCLARSAETVVALLAVLKAGGAYLPLDPDYPRERLALLLADAAAPLVVTRSNLAGLLPAAGPLQILLDRDAEAIARQPSGPLPPAAGPDHAAYVIYTSGSTGRPKGVVVTHRNVARLFIAAAPWLELAGDDVWTLFHSFAFDFSVWEIWGALLHGGRLVVVPYWASRSPDTFRGLLRDEQVTVLNQTPSAFRQLVEAEERVVPAPTGPYPAVRSGALGPYPAIQSDAPGPYPALRLILFGGESLDPRHLRTWFARHGDRRPRLFNLYGITETTVHVTCRPLAAADARSGRSEVGRPLADLAVRVLDPGLRPAPIGIPGELCVGGAGLARGYLGRPELTAERFVPDPFARSAGDGGARLYRSGDLARWRPDGDIEVLGRIDLQVKIRGFRIEPGEIEAALREHPGVRECAVLASEEAGGHRRLIAYQVSRGEPVPAAELRAFLAERLPGPMLPAGFVALASLPLTAHGKLDRRALPALAPAAMRPSGEAARPQTPRTPVEQAIAASWSEVLDVRRVGLDDDFFALGGDSIRGIQVRVRAEERGVSFTLRQLFQHPTVRNLAEVAAEVDAEGSEMTGPAVGPGTPPFSLISAADRSRLPEGVEDAYPLTRTQAGLVFHSEYGRDYQIYVSSLHLRAPLDVGRLRLALSRLVARHPLLRTSFALQGFSAPLQLVHRAGREGEPLRPELAVVDLRGLAPAVQEEVVTRWLAVEVRRKFDWGRPPLIRLHLHPRGEDTFQLTLSEPFLDGWSVGLFLTELFTRYLALVAAARPQLGLPAEPPDERPLASSFADYVALERDALASAEQRAFWELRGDRGDGGASRLPRNCPVVCAVVRAAPGAGPPPPVVRLEVPVPRTVSLGLRQAALGAGVPLKDLLLAAHLRVLAFLTGESDVVTAHLINGRPEGADGDRILGGFLNAMPFRMRLVPGSWLDLARQTFATELELLPFRRYPLAEMAEMAELQRRRPADPVDPAAGNRPEGGGSLPAAIGRPPFDTLFNFTHFHLYERLQRIPGLAVLGSAGSEQTYFPLTAQFNLDEITAQVTLGLDYLAAELAPAEASAIAARYDRVLAAIARAPLSPHDGLCLLSPAERQQVVLEWGEMDAPYRFSEQRSFLRGEPVTGLAHELFAAQAARRPDARALLWEQTTLTYGELAARASSLARRLAAAGAGPEARVGVLLERSPQMVAAILGALAAGAAYVPLDPGYPPERTAAMIAGARAGVVVTRRGLVELLPPEVSCLLVDEPDEGAPVPANLSDRPLRPAGSAANGGSGGQPLDPPPTLSQHGVSSFHPDGRGALPANLFAVIFTSGSTGQPKGVAIEHRGVSHFLAAAARLFGPADRAGVLAAASICFDLSIFELFLPLANGGTAVLAGGALDLPRLPAREDVTMACLVPSTAADLVRSGGGFPDSLRALTLGGEALPAPLVQALVASGAACRVSNHYGPTEATIYSLFAPVDCKGGGGGGADAGAPPIGRAVAGERALLLDGWLQPVAPGVPGEICLGGSGLARGYFARPDLTAERFVPDPASALHGEPGARLYRTGDLARQLPDGRIEFLGRRDHQVKVRGFRIELGDVEAAVARHPEVAQAVVVARGEEGIGPDGVRLVAYVVARDSRRTSAAGPAAQPLAHDASWAAELRDFAALRLPPFMVPSVFVTLDALPLTPAGKVDRRALPAPPDRRGGGGARPLVAPRTPVEEVLCGLWAEVFGMERVSAGDDFFALGGHSLLATRLISRLRAAFRLELPLDALFAAPRLSDLARVIEGELAGGDAAGPAEPPLAAGPRPDAVPLSFAQQRLWFLDRLQPGSCLYNIPNATRLRGGLAAPALAAACLEIVRRHEVLRTRFPAVEGRPVQEVSAEPEAPLPLLDLAALSVAAREAETARLCAAAARRPFDLGSGPVLRLLLLRLASEEHVLLSVVHHIAADGWSVDVFLRELALLYRAFSAKERSTAPPLPALPLQYADFTLWQRARLQGAVLDRQLAWWRERLQGVPPLTLPADRPRSSTPAYRGARRRLELPAGVAEAAAGLARREGATLFMTVLCAFAAVLGRHAGQEDFAIGYPIANRNRLEIEPLIGFFANTLVLRADLAGDPAGRDLLGRCREAVLGAHAHQDLPFERLVEELRPERDLSRTPLFQAALAFQNAPPADVARIDLPGLAATPVEIEPGAARFELTLFLVEQRDGCPGSAAALAGELEWNADLFDRATAARFLGHFRILLADLAADAGRRLSELSLLTEAERHQVLYEWAKGRLPEIGEAGEVGAAEPLVHRLIAAQAARTPAAAAIAHAGGELLTYGALAARTQRLARRLRASGVGPEVVVGIRMERGAPALVAILAVLEAGGAYLPLDPSYPDERLAFMLADAGVRLVLDESSESAVADSEPASNAGQGPGDVRPSDLQPLPENAAYVIYTSGSTGQPKGVVVSHRALLRSTRARLQGYSGLVPAFLLLPSLAFDSSVAVIFWTLCQGGRLVIPDRSRQSDPVELARLIAEHGVSHWLSIPPLYAQLLAHHPQPSDLGPLRTVIVAGEPCPAQLVAEHHARLPGVMLHNEYGPTEATVWATVDAPAPGGTVTIGRPIAGVEARLLDRALAPVPAGVGAELLIGGAGLSRGYLGRPGLTARRFIPDPLAGISAEPGARLYRTGDLAGWLPDGRLELRGRIDRQVKIRGFRIELGEVEAALLRHPGVRRAAALARDLPSGGRGLVACFEPAAELPAAALAPAEARRYLAERLPAPMVPAELFALPALPLLPNGKVDDRALLALLPASADSAGRQPGTPADELETRLAGLWADLLGLAAVGRSDSFFELGGHSLLAVELMARIQRELGRKLPLAALFRGATVESMAAALRQESGPLLARPLVAIRPRGAERPFFWVHPLGGRTLCYADLARRLAGRPSYGLEAPGSDGLGEPSASVEELAALYVEALGRVQTSGPYLLGGWSFGGLIAWEMARQLAERGAAVALVALLDTTLPSPRTLRTLRTLQTLRGPAGEPSRRDDVSLSALLRAEPGGAALDQRQLDRLLAVVEAHLHAFAAYRPRPLACPVALLGAEERPPAAGAGARGVAAWRRLARGPFHYRRIPGDHYAMLREPRVSHVATELEALLARTARNSRRQASQGDAAPRPSEVN
ncbi:MAG TPA: amino acid adenylation domain-containing protein [Thermoanaerobaculia bacterium]|nr:amino acid adenylation domain-containing protein [Thermoanaerobaculia bacterium]